MELEQIIHFFEQFCGISFVLYVIVFLAWLSLRKINREHNKVYLSKYIDVLEEILEAIIQPTNPDMLSGNVAVNIKNNADDIEFEFDFLNFLIHKHYY